MTKVTSNTIISCRILYSTQSGRAKACARRTGRILSSDNNVILQNGNKGCSFDQDPILIQSNYDVYEYAKYLQTNNTTLILFVSTTGDGEHTDTIRMTWKQLLQKSLPNDLLTGVTFYIFNLGDRAYGPQKYCVAGRKLIIRLKQLGATIAGEPGYGDDNTPSGGVFYDLDQWIMLTLLPNLITGTNNTTNTEQQQSTNNNININQFPPPYQVTVMEEKVEQHDDHNEELTKFQNSYQDFFQRQGPVTAYIFNSNDNKNTQLGEAKTDNDNNNSIDDNISSALLVGKVVKNQRITASDWEQNTCHIQIQVQQQSGTANNEINNTNTTWSIDSLPYRAGDVAAILPTNTSKDVNAFLKVLPMKLQEIADCVINIRYDTSQTDINRYNGIGYQYWPINCTLRGWLTYCADIHGLPEREDLRSLAQYCSIENHIRGLDQYNKLISLSETRGSALYADYILREKRNWIDVLYDFDSIRADGSLLTIEALLGLIAPIRIREFSIASSPTQDWINRNNNNNNKQDDDTNNSFGIDLCVAVVEGTTRLGRTYHGLCSHYLAQCQPNTNLRIWIRPGSFHGLPLEIVNNDFNVPILCVGAGTGIAPLRALIQEREVLLKIKNDAATTNTTASTPTSDDDNNEFDRDNILVFGCRKKSCDFYYEQEWNELIDSARLCLLTAFSRDQWHKIYVQQTLALKDSENNNNNFISRHILEKGGAVYIAGGPKMARAVKETIIESLTKHLDGDEKRSQQYLTKLQRVGKYSVEAWN